MAIHSCSTCRYGRLPVAGDDPLAKYTWECTRNLIYEIQIDRVYGASNRLESGEMLAHTERMSVDINACGPKGQYWEPKYLSWAVDSYRWARVRIRLTSGVLRIKTSRLVRVLAGIHIPLCKTFGPDGPSTHTWAIFTCHPLGAITWVTQLWWSKKPRGMSLWEYVFKGTGFSWHMQHVLLDANTTTGTCPICGTQMTALHSEPLRISLWQCPHCHHVLPKPAGIRPCPNVLSIVRVTSPAKYVMDDYTYQEWGE